MPRKGTNKPLAIEDYYIKGNTTNFFDCEDCENGIDYCPLSPHNCNKHVPISGLNCALGAGEFRRGYKSTHRLAKWGS